MNPIWKSGRRVRSLWMLATAAALSLLASCGGGTLENAFSPRRIVSFGDETSVLNNNGTRYGVNYADTTTGAASCGTYPVWTQYLANSYNLPFQGCVVVGGNAPSVMHAALGADVPAVTAQIDAHLASDSLGQSDLVTLMIGANDILAQYNLYIAGAESLDSAQGALQQSAIAVVAQIQRIVNLGAKVLISTVPNQGLTPYGVADASGVRASELTTLSTAYNTALRTALVTFSGRDVGLILSDEIVRLDSVYPGSYSLVNATNPVCAAPVTAALLTCNNLTLNPGGVDPSTYLWAGNYQIGPTAQLQIGEQAYSRATNNPF